MINFNDDILPFGNYFQFNQEYNQVFKFLDDHTNKCIAFLHKSLGNFQNLATTDQIKILANGIHPIRMLQLAGEVNCENYFNCDNQTFERLCYLFPIFNEILPYLKSLIELIRGLKLDAKEFSLYSALIAFSSCKLFLF